MVVWELLDEDAARMEELRACEDLGASLASSVEGIAESRVS